MNTRGQTLIEVTIASILAMLLMTSSIKVIEITHRETNRFKTQVDNDTTWMTANMHLAKTVRASSYLEVSGAGTLVLRNYDRTEKGRYTYNAGRNRLEYYTNDGTILQETFANVTAAFSPPSAGPTGKGWRNNRLIEAIVNYDRPFANSVYLACRVSTAPPLSATWAKLISADWPGAVGVVATPILNHSGGQIMGYAMVAEWEATTMLYAIDRNGNTMSSIPSQHYGGIGIDQPESIEQTFDKQTGGNPTGFIVSGIIDHYSASRSYIMKLGTSGSIEWIKGTNESGYPQNTFQMFNAAGDPDGYVSALCGSSMRLLYIANDGSFVRQIRLGRTGFWNYVPLVIPVLSKNGSRDGFLGLSLVSPSGAGEPERNYYFTRVRETPSAPYMVYDKVFMENINRSTLLRGHDEWGSGYTSFGSLKQIVNENLEPDGFLATMYSDKLESTILIKIKSDGTIEWSKRFNGVMTFWEGRIAQTFTRQYGGRPTGYIIAFDNSYGHPLIVKLDNDGEIVWQQPGLANRINGSLTIMQNFDAKGLPDGYIYISDAYDGMRMKNNHSTWCIYMVKMDNLGNCPEIADPKLTDLGWKCDRLFDNGPRIPTDSTYSTSFVDDTTDYTP